MPERTDINTSDMAGSRQFGYPLNILAKRLSGFGFLVFFWLALATGHIVHGRMRVALEFTIGFIVLMAFPVIVKLISYSTIICDNATLSAKCLGIIWRKTSWADVGFVQRVRTFADPSTKTRLLSDRFFIGRGEKKTWRISFSAEISGLEELLGTLASEAEKNNFGLYTVDTVPKQYGQMREGLKVSGFIPPAEARSP